MLSLHAVLNVSVKFIIRHAFTKNNSNIPKIDKNIFVKLLYKVFEQNYINCECYHGLNLRNNTSKLFLGGRINSNLGP